MRHPVGLVFIVFVAVWGQVPAHGETAAAIADASPSAVVLVTSNPNFRASIGRIFQGSALWRQAVEDLRSTGRQAIVLTPDQVLMSDGDGTARTGFDRAVLAESAPVADANSRVQSVLVVVNLSLLEQIHREMNSMPAEFETDLDRILIHEIYGHAMPYLLAGDLSGRCADPRPDERPSDACSIQRENAVRAELRLGRRADYGLQGLSLGRRALP